MEAMILFACVCCLAGVCIGLGISIALAKETFDNDS